MTIHLEIPESVAGAMRLPEPIVRDELLVELAVALYARRILSFGKARELSGLSKYEFGKLLGKRSVTRDYGSEELADDLTYAGRQ